MKKRLVGGLVLALAVSSLLGGCGEKATTSEKPETGKTKYVLQHGILQEMSISSRQWSINLMQNTTTLK